MNKKLLIPLISSIVLFSSCGTVVKNSAAVDSKKEIHSTSEKKDSAETKSPQNTNSSSKEIPKDTFLSQSYKIGDSGTGVGELQKYLNKFGYKLNVDNNFGINTKNSLIDFQIRNDIESDGVCGPKTIEKLKLAPTNKTTFDGKLKIPGAPDLEGFINNRNSSSPTSYYIWVNSSSHTVNVFTGNNHNWTLIKSMDCSMGSYNTPTIKGTFSLGDKGTFFETENGLICKFYSRIDGGYLFHSVLYNKSNELVDGRLGENISHGCIRLELDNAKWIYDTIPEESTIYIN